MNTTNRIEAGESTICLLSSFYYPLYIGCNIITYVAGVFFVIIGALEGSVKENNPPRHLPTGQAGPSQEGIIVQGYLAEKKRK
jgi:hypothetical protein